MAAKEFDNGHDRLSLKPFELLDNTLEISGIVGEISRQYPIPSEFIEDVYSTSPLQEGMMALSMLNPKSYILRRVLRLGPNLDVARFKSAWELAAEKNPILRTRFVPTPDAGAADLKQYLELDQAEGMVYGAAPVRYGLTEDGYFIWTAYHAVYDGWSLPLIISQVQSAYEHSNCPDSTPFNTFVKHLQTTDNQSSQSFWAEQLSGPRPSAFPQLPSLSYRPSVKGKLQHEIPVPHLADSTILRTTILRAAWGLVLSRYADRDDIVFGMTLSGRNGPVSGIDTMIGPTITTVPVRMKFPPALTVSEFLAQVQQQSTKMIPHEHFGLQNITSISSDCARGIEFPNLFVIQPVSDATEIGDLFPGVEEVELPLEDFDSYPLVVECFVADDKITIETRHDENVLSTWQVQTIMHHFEHILKQVTQTNAQEAQVASVDLFGAYDLEQIMQWNKQYPETVDSTMAVMKASVACVNLDPAHPQSRLETIVKDAKATVLLTNPRHADVLGTSVVLQAVVVTEDFISSLKGLTHELPTISPQNVAYVLFTSGSTAKPKGIVIEHGSLCSSSKAHGTRWGIGPGTRLLQFAAYTFDVSCADIFTTLQRGGCICIPSEEQRLNDLPGAINSFQCNWAFLTPMIAALLPADNLPSLKTLVLGGEASTRDTIAKWHSVLDLIVCYSPAECSVYCSGAPPAIATSNPADLGCVGELLLQGPTVARGYLHDAEKTSQAFVSNPIWAPLSGSRFYRTGDLVQYNEDGTIRFVGRKDTQVKVRGQRVELGEIEHAIRLAIPTLAHATVDAEAWNLFLQILRTVFAAHGDRFYQVVLKEVVQPIGWYQVEENIEPFSLLLCKEDVDKDLPLGTLLTQLSVVSNQKRHRMILRVSHAQYDGVCLSRIWKSFQEVLSGRTPAPEVPFSNFIANIDPGSQESPTYWRDVFSNSTMTPVVTQSKPQYQNVYDLHLTRTIPINSQSGSGITFAAILKTAWALVLSSLSGSTDVVFGHVVSGRNIPQLNIEQVISPCLNILPTRVIIGPSTNLNDLLDTVKAQHTAHMAHESLGTREIARKCSPWQPSTRMTSIVQHQNIEQDATVTINSQQYSVADFCPAADEADLAIKTTPLDNNQIEVLLITSPRSVGESMAAALLDHLCNMIQAICNSADAPVAVGLQRVHEDSPVGRIDEIPSLDAEKRNAIYASWREVLAQPELPLDLDSDFFAVGGDLVSIALLTAFWQRQGYQVAVEDLWDHSQVRGMLGVLVQPHP
ncbi:HC-toxin synthetase [Penicillium expansum]|nr:HC-toxin synthetase [Penicillium expansum]